MLWFPGSTWDLRLRLAVINAVFVPPIALPDSFGYWKRGAIAGLVNGFLSANGIPFAADIRSQPGIGFGVVFPFLTDEEEQAVRDLVI